MIEKYTHLYGLIGYPLTHSFSKKHFGDKFAREKLDTYYYELFPLAQLTDLPEILKKYPNLKGLNVTIPYKQSVIPFLDEISEEAKRVGAVNTIKITDGKLTGYNTDVYGFEKSLLGMPPDGDRLPTHALVLGTGGAAQAIQYVLRKMNITCQLVSRTASPNQITYEDLTPNHISDHPLIINTTPLGTFPKIDAAPALPYPKLTSKNYLFDLVYNPAETLFLRQGKKQGCKTKNGLEMLHLQAERAWQIWST